MIQAVIFDLDGTILDNEQDWDEAFMMVAKRNGITPLRQACLPARQGFGGAGGWWHEPGLGLTANWQKIVRDPILAGRLATETAQEYNNLNTGVKLSEGAVDVVQKVKGMGLMTALCTGSVWNVVERELEQLEMQLAFDVTTTGEEVLIAKPDPEIYLLTAQKLNLEPEECLVIEDAVAGVRAAVEAGMQAVGLVSDYAPEKMLRAAGAKAVTAGFTGFDINVLL